MLESETLPPPNPESLVARVETLEAFRTERENEAKKAADAAITRTLYNLDRTTGSSVSLQKVPDTALGGYVIGQLGFNDLISFDAVGIRTDDILSKTCRGSGEDGELLYEIREEEEKIEVKRDFDGVSLFFHTDKEPDFGSPNHPDKIAEKINQRFQQSPAHRAISTMRSKLEQGAPLGSLTTEEFNPNEDRLGTLAILSDLGFIGYWDTEKVVHTEAAVEDILDNGDRYGVDKIEEDGSVVYVRSEGGVQRQFRIDRSSNTASITFNQLPEYFYNERANQSSAESVPFIETECAAEMFSVLDSCGLAFSPKYQAEMLRIGESERFGSVYTQMSREVAKWVNRPSRQQVSILFMRYNPEFHAKGGSSYGFNTSEYNYRIFQDGLSQEELDAETSYISERLLSVDTSGYSEPTRVLLGMVQDCIKRASNNNIEVDNISTLPVTSSDVHIDGGACFDVAGYYIGAAGDRKGLRTIDVEGVPMLEKTHGAHTYMLMDGAVLNGVKLPKGTLMQRGEDGGWAMLRLTPFSFDSQIDRLATGPEIAKAEINEAHSIHSIGGTALANVVSGAISR